MMSYEFILKNEYISAQHKSDSVLVLQWIKNISNKSMSSQQFLISHFNDAIIIELNMKTVLQRQNGYYIDWRNEYRCHEQLHEMISHAIVYWPSNLK